MRETIFHQNTKKCLILVLFMVASLFVSQAQTTIFVKDGVTDGENITEGSETGVAYTTLQAAVDASYALTGNVTIKLVNDIVGDSAVVTQKPDLWVTIDGNSHGLLGQIILRGTGGEAQTSGLNLQNINFSHNPTQYEMPSFCNRAIVGCDGEATTYFKNLKVQNCTFAIPSETEVSGIAAVRGSNQFHAIYGLVMDNITASGGHSLLQTQAPNIGKSDTAIFVNNCTYTENTNNGINISEGQDNILVVIKNNTITTPDGYAFRMQNGGNNKTVYLSGNTFDAGEGIILKKNSGTNNSVYISSGWHKGPLTFTGNSTTTQLVLTGGTYTEEGTTVQTYCAPSYYAFDDYNNSPHTWTVCKGAFVSFDANGGSGTMADTLVRKDSLYTITGCAFTPPSDYAFSGWKDANGNDYSVDGTMRMYTDTTLYAQWSMGHTITYHRNFGTDSTLSQNKETGVDATLLGATAFERKGHQIEKWNTAADGSGTDYAVEGSYTDEADLVLYAIWELKPCPAATDYDGYTYGTIRIGSEYSCWTTSNLRSAHYSDGTEVADLMQYPATTRAVDAHGYLYTQNAALDADRTDLETAYSGGGIQGVCPTGWHLPTQGDMEDLVSSGDIPALLTEDWMPIPGTNTSGLTLLPSGFFNANSGYYEGRGLITYLWMGTPPSIIYHACELGAACGTYEFVPGTASMGYSVRCVADEAIDAFTCGTSTVTDIDDNTYNTVQIGEQCWMKENLRATKYANGTSISQGSSTSTTTAYWYYPDNNSSNKPTYGLLYNWKAVMGTSSSSSANPSGVQGICPDGWHVPSEAEWTQLTDYVSSQSDYVCESDNRYIAKALAGTTGWNSSTYTCDVGNTPSQNNATGFSALPAGYYYGSYISFGRNAEFWSATENNNSRAHTPLLDYGLPHIHRDNYNKNNGYSVRCVRD